MKSKKIFFLINSLDVGGAEVSLLKLVSNLQYDFEISVISLIPYDHSLKFKYNLDSVVFVNFELNTKILFSVFNLYKYFKREKPDVVHCWLSASNVIGGITSYFAGIKNIVWSIRNSDPIQIGTSLFSNTFTLISIPLSYFIPNQIVFPSERSLKNYSKFGYCLKKMHIIPNGFNIPSIDVVFSDRKDFLLRYNLESSSFIIGSVGRYNKSKDHVTFIKACQLLFNRFPDFQIHVFIIGRNVVNDKLLSLVKGSIFFSRYHFIEEVNNLNLFYPYFDLFCLHSITESFPNVLAEAMSFGCLAISSDVGDAKIIINDDKLIFPPQSPKDLYSLFLKILEMNIDLKKQIKLKNYFLIQNKYSLDKMLERYKKTFISFN